MNDEIPTEPGYYLDRDGDVWRIDGNRRRPVATGYDHLTAEPYVPFTRLVPLSVEDRTLIYSAVIGALSSAHRTAPEAVDALRALAARIAPDQNGDDA